MVFGDFWVVKREFLLENRYKAEKLKQREEKERVLLEYQINNPFRQQRYAPSTSSAHFMYFQHLLLSVSPAGWRQVRTSKKDNPSTRTMLPVKLMDIPDAEENEFTSHATVPFLILDVPYLIMAMNSWSTVALWRNAQWITETTSSGLSPLQYFTKPPHGKSIPNTSNRNKNYNNISSWCIGFISLNWIHGILANFSTQSTFFVGFSR